MKVRVNKIIIDNLISSNDGMDSNWSVEIKNGRQEDKLIVGLYWGDKETPTHEGVISKSDLLKYLGEI